MATSTSRTSRRGLPGIGKSSISWIGGHGVVMRRATYLPSPSTPFRRPFGPSATEVYLSGRRRRARLLPASLRPPLKLDVQFSRITFHEDAALRAAIEGIIPTKLTSPYSP